MIKRVFCLLAVWFFALFAYGQGQMARFILTNNINDLNPESGQLTMTSGYARITAYNFDGARALSPTGLIGMSCYLISRDDGYDLPLTSAVARILTTNAAGWARFEFGSIPAGNYRLMAGAVYTNDSFPIMDRYLTCIPAETFQVVFTASIAGTTLVLTNEVNIVNVVITQETVVVTNQISMNAVVTNVIFPQILSLNGIHSGDLEIVGDGGSVVTNNGNKIYVNTYTDRDAIDDGNVRVRLTDGRTYWWGLMSGVGAYYPTVVGTNRVRFLANGSGVTNKFIVPAGVTNIVAWIWGGGAAGGSSAQGGAGGFIRVTVPVTPGQVYNVVVAMSATGGVLSSTTGSTWWGGGRSRSTSGTVGAGGGGSYLQRDWDLGLVALGAGGGGGADAGSSQSAGGNGGGYVSGNGAYSYTNSLARAPRADNAWGEGVIYGSNVYYSTVVGPTGSMQEMTGGIGLVIGAVGGAAGGGGAGHPGGPGGVTTGANINPTQNSSSGAGGLSYANAEYCTEAYTVRTASYTTAPAFEIAEYVAGVSVGSLGGIKSGPGLIVIGY